MYIRRKILKEISEMLSEDQISPEEAAFLIGYNKE